MTNMNLFLARNSDIIYHTKNIVANNEIFNIVTWNNKEIFPRCYPFLSFNNIPLYCTI